jgi:hypothetical protein
MESARRASAIHEKRTGRALRITEADVINEEMYEEINDLPTEYRRLNAHLHTQSADFDRRLLAYLACQMATRQAVSNCWQNEQSNTDTRGVNFGTPQEPFSNATSASPAAGGMINYGQAPYQHATQDVPWIQHGRTASMYAPGFDQQYLQPSLGSPFTGGRHMSLPSDSTMQPPHPSSTVPMDALDTSNISRIDSAVDMTGSPQHLHHPTMHNFNNPKSSHQPWQAHRRPSIEPLSTALPLDGQQFFATSPQAFNPNASHQQIPSPSQNFTNRRYSYNPNGRQKVASSSVPHPYSNHFTAPTTSVEASPTGSPLRSDMSHGSRPSTSHGGALSQACHDAGGMGPNVTLTGNALKETGDATAPGMSTP